MCYVSVFDSDTNDKIMIFFLCMYEYYLVFSKPGGEPLLVD